MVYSLVAKNRKEGLFLTASKLPRGPRNYTCDDDEQIFLKIPLKIAKNLQMKLANNLQIIYIYCRFSSNTRGHGFFKIL